MNDEELKERVKESMKRATERRREFADREARFMEVTGCRESMGQTLPDARYKKTSRGAFDHPSRWLLPSGHTLQIWEPYAKHIQDDAVLVAECEAAGLAAVVLRKGIMWNPKDFNAITIFCTPLKGSKRATDEELRGVAEIAGKML